MFCGLMAHLSVRPERWSQIWFRGVLRALNVRLQILGPVPEGDGLLAGNHVSWLDIAVLVSAKPVIFVSKDEVAHWPLIGWMARGGDTLFIQRGAHGTRQLNQDITATLLQGRSVVIFPEGTTTAGPGVRRFHSRLYAGAIASKMPVLPFAVRYREASAPYVDQQSLAQNLWAIMAEPQLDVELHFGPPLPPAPRRDTMARQTQRWVEKTLVKPPGWPAPGKRADRI